MKKKIIIIKNTILIILLYLIITNKNSIINAVIISINIFIYQLLPSIFPIMIISKSLADNLIIPSKIKNIFNKIFKFNGNSIILIIIAFIVGSPTCQILYKKAYEEHQISKLNYEKLIISTSLINPFFFWNIVNYLSNKTKIIILVLNYLITIFLWFSIKNDSFTSQNSNLKSNFLNNINESFKVLFNILSIIIFFNITLSLLHNYINNIAIKSIFVFFEITNGYIYLSNLVINKSYNVILTAFLTSFMGLCINYQIKSIIQNNTLYKRFIKWIIIKGLIVALISSMFT